MEITKREILVSIIMVCLMLLLGFFIDAKIVEGQILSKEKYTKALKIDNNNDMFKYAIDTNIGNIIVYGNFNVDKGITTEWLKNDYMYIERVTEEYSKHTRTECTGSGEDRTCKTETYYTWDVIGSQSRSVDEIEFSGVIFNFGEFTNYPKYRLGLNNETVIDKKQSYIKDNCIYEKKTSFFGSSEGDKRYFYKIINKNFSGTVFGTAKDNKFIDKNRLVINHSNIEQFIESGDIGFILGRIGFWLIYLTICGYGVYCYLEYDNDYLED